MEEEFYNYYDFLEGGDASMGHDLNPVTGQPYEPQMVPRGDYTRVLAEFWADGPDSETPPGHWFTLINYVNSHPMLEKRYEGVGPIIDDLEWDIKSYFLLGAAMHDSAVSTWSIKGFYDYLRPQILIPTPLLGRQIFCKASTFVNYRSDPHRVWVSVNPMQKNHRNKPPVLQIPPEMLS